MRLNFSRFLSFVLTMTFILLLNPETITANENVQNVPVTVIEEEGSVSFLNLNSLETGENIECIIIDPYGGNVTVGLERVANNQAATTANGNTVAWKVSYTSGLINCSFYMNVSENKVTSVYDESITIVGGTYDEASLKRTSTYGKLSFKYKSYLGIVSRTCWLKGTVTGADDGITVTYQM